MKTRSSHSIAKDKHAALPDDRAAKANEKKIEAAYDAVLVERCKAGDEAAFTEIIQRYYSRIKALAERTLHKCRRCRGMAQDTSSGAPETGTFRATAPWPPGCIASASISPPTAIGSISAAAHVTVSIDQPVMEDSNLSLSERFSDHTADPRGESMTHEFLSWSPIAWKSSMRRTRDPHDAHPAQSLVRGDCREPARQRGHREEPHRPGPAKASVAAVAKGAGIRP